MAAGAVTRDLLDELDNLLSASDPRAALEFLIERFREAAQYNLIFEARLMQKRHELGLALIQTQDASAFPPETRAPYEAAMVEAAREVGGLYLASGAIERAWPYFRAVGDAAPVREALEKAEPTDENIDSLIAIAIQEGVHPARGFALILERHGMCRALTSFGMYPVEKDREQCIGLLARGLHEETLERLRAAIAANEGTELAETSIPALIANRGWLFGEYDYYVDTSHVYSILPYSLEVRDPETLSRLYELCEYGKRLSTNFQARGDAPFEDTFADYGRYIAALRGEDADAHIAHFRETLARVKDTSSEGRAAEALIHLLVRLKRFEEALAVSLAVFPQGGASETCPGALELCRLAGNYGRLREVARERGDLLSYTAASFALA